MEDAERSFLAERLADTERFITLGELYLEHQRAIAERMRDSRIAEIARRLFSESRELHAEGSPTS